MPSFPCSIHSRKVLESPFPAYLSSTLYSFNMDVTISLMNEWDFWSQVPGTDLLDIAAALLRKESSSRLGAEQEMRPCHNPHNLPHCVTRPRAGAQGLHHVLLFRQHYGIWNLGMSSHHPTIPWKTELLNRPLCFLINKRKTWNWERDVILGKVDLKQIQRCLWTVHIWASHLTFLSLHVLNLCMGHVK